MDATLDETLQVKPNAPGPDLEDERLRAALGAKLFGREERLEIDRFQVMGRLGSGGMGVVYDAWDPRLRRRVALKVVRPDRDDPMLHRRLLREARAAAQLKHPNVVTIYEVGEHEHLVWIAMEFIAGKTLQAWTADEKPKWREVVAMYLAAGEGLAEAHRKGLVHRDFKPANVLIERDGRGRSTPRVVDFGLARRDEGADQEATEVPMQTSADDEHTAEDRIMGTPAYMAPEQVSNGVVDGRADQFAFCVSLYEALHGHRPFSGTTLFEVYVEIEEGRFQPSSRRVPTWLSAALRRGLAFAPGDRHGSMDELLEALRRGLDRRRRTSLFSGGAGLVGLVAAFALWPNPDPCAGAGDEAEAVWNADIRAALSAWFEPEASTFGAESASSYAANVDRWFDRWQSRRVGVCQAQTGQGADPSEIYELRTGCMDRQLRFVEGLLEQTRKAEATPHAMAAAVESSLELPELSICDDTESLLRETPLVADPDTRQRAQQLDAELAQLEGAMPLISAEAGLEQAKRLRAQAETIGHAPLLARAETLLARAHVVATDRKAALVELRAAFRHAIEGRSESAAANAALLAAWAQIEQHDDLDDARRWLDDAEAFVVAEGDPPGHRSLWLDHSGVLAVIRGDLVAAEKLHAEALEIRKATPGLELPAVLSRINLAGAISMKREPERAMAQFDLARDELETVVGPNHPLMAKLLTNIGATLQRDGRNEEAVANLERALEIKTVAFGKDSPELGTTLVNLANAEWALEHRDEAISLLKRALDLRERHLGDAHPRLIIPLQNIAESYREMNGCEEALPYFARAEKIAVDTFGESNADVLYSRMGIASCKVALGQPDQALPLYEGILQHAEEAQLDPYSHADISLEFAVLLRGTEPTRARALVEQARAICTKSPAACDEPLMKRLAKAETVEKDGPASP